MDTYAAVFKMVEPKRLARAAAQVRALGRYRLIYQACLPAGVACMGRLFGCCCLCAAAWPAAADGGRHPAQAALDASNAVLAEKRARLAAIRDKVAALQRQLADAQAELGSLTFQARALVGARCSSNMAVHR
jgi:septal ring factor EnvC (AmiA/AmiB activator)